MSPAPNPGADDRRAVLAFVGARSRGRLEQSPRIQLIPCRAPADVFAYVAQRGRPAAIIVDAWLVGHAAKLLRQIRNRQGDECPPLIALYDEAIAGADLVLYEPWDASSVLSFLELGGERSAPLFLNSGRVQNLGRTLVREALLRVCDEPHAHQLMTSALQASGLAAFPTDRDELTAFVEGPLQRAFGRAFGVAHWAEVSGELRMSLGDRRATPPDQSTVRRTTSTKMRAEKGRGASGVYSSVSAGTEGALELHVVLVEPIEAERVVRRLERVVSRVTVSSGRRASAEASKRGAAAIVVVDEPGSRSGRAEALELRSRGCKIPVVVLVADEPEAEGTKPWHELAWPATRFQLKRFFRELDPR